MKTKLLFSMLTMAAALAVTPDVFAGNTEITGSTSNGSDDTYTDGTNGGSTTIGTVSKTYLRGIGTGSSYWTGVNITTTGTVSGYELTITTNSGTTDQDLYFTGTNGDGTDSLTITGMTVTNGGTSTSGTYNTTKAFIVEGTTVILDGVNVSELGMNLVIGTEYNAGDATLVITNGSTVSTGAFYNDVGSNLNTGTITISEGSTLSTQQITLGCGVNSLFACDQTSEGDYWTKCFVDQSTFEAIRNALFTEGYTGSYGIVNVYSGSTFNVGVGNTSQYSNKFQLSNGELNIDGKGSQMIIGDNSEFLLMGEQAFSDTSSDTPTYSVMTGMYLTEKISVTGGGKLTNETGTKVEEIWLGEDFLASNTTVDILVSGKDEDNTASTFDLAASDSVDIGTVIGYDYTYGNGKMDGGTMDVTIKAEKGGVFNATADNGIYVCADNYASYLLGQGEVGHSYGINVKLSAESGGSLTLDANGSEVLLGAGSPYEGEEYKNTLTITADGKSEDGDTASSVTISGGDIYTNYGEDGTGGVDSVSVKISATNGGTIALTATAGMGSGNASTGTISFGKNTKITVENGSSLTTDGTVLFNSGASVSVDATSKWTTDKTTSVTFSEDSSLSITAGASAIIAYEGGASANVILGEVHVESDASIIVTIDISSLDNYTEASVAILTAESIIYDYNGGSGTTLVTGTTESGDNYSETLASFVDGYITLTDGDFELDSWFYVVNGDGTNTLYANIRTLPEPSMFGLFAGLMAVGLVSTRRRRRKA